MARRFYPRFLESIYGLFLQAFKTNPFSSCKAKVFDRPALSGSTIPAPVLRLMWFAVKNKFRSMSGPFHICGVSPRGPFNLLVINAGTE